MRYISDLHIHSYYSRATSKQLNLEHLNKWAQIKGLQVIATGDITHPQWLKELREKLEPEGNGFFQLKPEYKKLTQAEVPHACEAEVRFILSGEISNIYKKNGRVRKNHNVVFFPTLDAVQAFQTTLDRIGNIHSDGRPILGLDARDLLEIVLDTDEQGHLIPAHIWTPWFSVLGSKSGFDNLQDCFEDLTPHIFALETGLSSDPPMNWRLSALDPYTLVSNSDAHSPAKLAREANIVDTDVNYRSLFEAIRTGHSFLGTIEFFPQEGKYHMDGHRKCSCMMHPSETIKHNHICPVCGKPVTLGVSYRVEELADRPEGFTPPGAKPFYSLIPLPELLSEVMQVGSQSKRVHTAYFNLLNALGSELSILMDVPVTDIQHAAGDLVAEAVKRMRAGRVAPQPGYDGEFGVIRIFKLGEREQLLNQNTFFQTQTNKTVKEKKNVTITTPVPSIKKASDQKESYGVNQEQHQAINHRGSPIIVQAGPGTGKTYTLTRRIASLIESGHTVPRAVLAITFTNKAAEEMQTRLDTLLDRESAELITILTFHSFGATLLRTVESFYGRSNDFVIINPSKDDQFLKILKESVMFNRTGLDQISLLKAKGYTPDTIPPDELSRTPDIKSVFHAYEQTLLQMNAVDFDDLIGLTVRLLRQNPDIRRDCLKRYTCIAVDEFQDINQVQYELFKIFAISAEHVCVIGDPDQAIYGFRGARSEFFNRFTQEFPHARQIQLKRNYRSVQNVLTASMQMLGKSSDDNSLWSHISPDVKVRITSAPTDRAEAEYIVHQIEQLVGGTTFFSMDSQRVKSEQSGEFSFADFAILLRTKQLSSPLIEALTRSGIPYQLFDHNHILQHPFAKIVIHAMRLHRGQHIHNDWAPLKEHFEHPEDFVSFQQNFLTLKRDASPAELLHFLHDTFRKRLNDDWFSTDYTSLKKLAETFYDKPDQFADALILQKSVDELDDRADRVRLMTIHAAKGLEFPIVFIAGCEEGIIPHFIQGQQTDMDEERRILYVGMTRAKHLLYLSHARKRSLWHKIVHQEPSRFLAPISESLIERGRHSTRNKPRDRQLELF